MFTFAVNCMNYPAFEQNGTPGATVTTPYKLSLTADLVIGLALLAIGICALQFGFISSSWGGALIGVGATALTFTLERTARFIKATNVIL